MAVFSIIQKSQLEGAHRIDAEFYCAETGNIKHFKLGDFAAELLQYGTSKELNEEERGYPVLRLNEFEDFFISKPEKFCDKLSKEEFQQLTLKRNDVLVCRTNGNPQLVGKATVVMEDTMFAFASYLFKIRTNQGFISPKTLVTFLNSKLGRGQIEKFLMPSIQSNFSPTQFRQIKIPIFDQEFQEQIDSLINDAYLEQRKSKQLFTKAESQLLKELGLKDDTIDDDLSFVVKLSDVTEAHRIDAEYFQPKYERLFVQLEKKNAHPLEKLVTSLGHATQSTYSDSGDIAVLAQKHMKPNLEVDVNGFDNFTTSEKIAPQDKKYLLEPGDVLISSVGDPGLTCVWTHDHKQQAIPGSYVTHIRADKKINPFYLGVFLNSFAGKLQFEKFQAASVQQYVYPKNIKKLLIPVLPSSTQESVGDLVIKSHEARKKSKELLEEAKRKVEEMVEKGGGEHV